MSGGTVFGRLPDALDIADSDHNKRVVALEAWAKNARRIAQLLPGLTDSHVELIARVVSRMHDGPKG